MMRETKSIKKIKKHWDDQAERYGVHPLATCPDAILDDLVVKSIAKYLLPEKYILDVGCGNGNITIRLAQIVKSNFVGCDYSEKMIEKANEALKDKKSSFARRLEFVVGDALHLPFKDKSFDIIFTNRCLINLTKLKDQLIATKEVHRVLKKGGLYIMSENSKSSLKNLNQLRKAVELPSISSPWHNLYIDEEKFFSSIKKLFDLQLVDNFCSSYYIGSRIFNGKVSAMKGKEPDYDDPINHIAADLPSIGDFGPQKTFILKKI